MSKQGLASAIGLATVDKSFRDSLLNDPANAVSGTKLEVDPSEIDFLKEEGTRAAIREYAERMKIYYDTAGAKSR